MYSKSAFDKFKELDTAKVLKFFEQVPQRDRRFILGQYAVPPGFRPNSDATIAQQSQRLASRISSGTLEKAAGTDGAVMERMWEAWLRANLGDEEFVEQCIGEWRSALENGANEADECASTAANAVLVKSLKQLSDRNLCGREDLRTALLFGPFEPSEDLHQLIADTKTRAEIKEAQEFTLLPAKIATLGKRLDKISNRSLENEGRLNELNSSVVDLEAGVSSASNFVKAFGRKLATLSSDYALLGKSNDALKEQNEKLRQSYEKSEQAGRASEKARAEWEGSIENGLAEIRTISTDLARGMEGAAKRLAALEASLQAAQDVVSDRLDQIETAQARKGGTEAGTYEHSEGVPTIRFCTLRSSGESHPLPDWESIVQALQDTYQSIGLPTREAASLSREVFCGMVCDQVIFFKGLFANVVATVTGNTLANGNCYQAAVPIGCMHQLLSHAKPWNDESEGVPCVILQNANRSPLEGYGQSLIDRSLLRFTQAEPKHAPLACLATIDDGPAGLPLNRTFFATGPVFDTDALGWRQRKSRRSVEKSGRVDRQKWSGIAQSVQSINPGSSPEFDQLIGDLTLDSGWVRRLRWQYSYLLGLYGSTGSADALASLLFGWILPPLIAEGAAYQDAIAQIRGGEFESGAPDNRLQYLLAPGLAV